VKGARAARRLRKVPSAMDRLFQDLKIAIRALLRQRTFSVMAVLTLALGVGATTAIFSVVYGILLKPLPYVEADRLLTFGQTAKRSPEPPVDGSSSHVNFLDWQREAKTIETMALYSGGRAVISSQGEADVVPIGSVTPDFFAVFKIAPIQGRSGSVDGRMCSRSRSRSAACPGPSSASHRGVLTFRPAHACGCP
jgi:putative ABC transport system permease protein